MGLAWTVQPNQARFEVEFTNQTQRELAIVLGKQRCRLKPGKSHKLQFKNRQILKVAEVDAKDRSKMRYMGAILPQANRGTIPIEKG